MHPLVVMTAAAPGVSLHADGNVGERAVTTKACCSSVAAAPAQLALCTCEGRANRSEHKGPCHRVSRTLDVPRGNEATVFPAGSRTDPSRTRYTYDHGKIHRSVPGHPVVELRTRLRIVSINLQCCA